LYRLRSCLTAILFDIDAFDSKRTNSLRPLGNVPGDGRSCRSDLSDCGQRWDGHRLYAGYRESLAVNELRRFLGAVHVSGSGHGTERPDEPYRELTPRLVQVCKWPAQA